jgi:hypothetical protein
MQLPWSSGVPVYRVPHHGEPLSTVFVQVALVFGVVKQYV